MPAPEGGSAGRGRGGGGAGAKKPRARSAILCLPLEALTSSTAFCLVLGAGADFKTRHNDLETCLSQGLMAGALATYPPVGGAGGEVLGGAGGGPTLRAGAAAAALGAAAIAEVEVAAALARTPRGADSI